VKIKRLCPSFCKAFYKKLASFIFTDQKPACFLGRNGGFLFFATNISAIKKVRISVQADPRYLFIHTLQGLFVIRTISAAYARLTRAGFFLFESYSSLARAR
jgi:hypothetical protein